MTVCTAALFIFICHVSIVYVFELLVGMRGDLAPLQLGAQAPVSSEMGTQLEAHQGEVVIKC